MPLRRVHKVFVQGCSLVPPLISQLIEDCSAIRMLITPVFNNTKTCNLLFPPIMDYLMKCFYSHIMENFVVIRTSCVCVFTHRMICRNYRMKTQEWDHLLKCTFIHIYTYFTYMCEYVLEYSWKFMQKNMKYSYLTFQFQLFYPLFFITLNRYFIISEDNYTFIKILIIHEIYCNHIIVTDNHF